MAVRNVDELLLKYGGKPGKYQTFLLCLLCLALCSSALNDMMSLFIITAYPHHCKIPDNYSKSEYIPKLENDEYDSCLVYINASDHELGTTECTSGWQFYPPDNEWNVVQEWDLVCDKHYQAALGTTIYFAGVTVGSAVFGYLADMIGRKPVMVTTLTLCIIITAAIPFSSTFLVYVFLRFIHGLLLQGNCAYVMAIEVVSPHGRTMIGIVAQCLWPCMLLLLSGLFYFFKSWITVHLICNVPFVVTIAYIWLVPESIRWLLAVGNVSRAKIELTRVCRLNKLPVDDAQLADDVQNVVQDIQRNRMQTERNYGLMDLIRKKKMRIISFMSCYYYFVAFFAFYGILFAMTGFKVNIYASFAVVSFLELLASIILYFIMQRIGRKSTTFYSLAICSGLSVVVAILQLTLPEGESSEMGVTIVATLGLIATVALFSCMPIYCNELSPTVLRNLLFGIGNVWGQIGAMVAPQVMLLEIYVWKPLPFVICATMTCVAAMLTHLLPETWNKPLPDIPEDVHTLWSNGPGQNSNLPKHENKHEKDENQPLTNSIKA